LITPSVPLAPAPRAARSRGSGFVLWQIAAPDLRDGTSAVGESQHRIPRRIRWL